jgi:hypothetical protein
VEHDGEQRPAGLASRGVSNTLLPHSSQCLLNCMFSIHVCSDFNKHWWLVCPFCSSVSLFICRMDATSSFNLEIRIVSPRCRDGGWFSLDKVVDADVTNFRDLVDGVVDKYPCDYGDIIILFYFCMDTKFFNIILSYITCHTLLIMTYKTNIQIWSWFQ